MGNNFCNNCSISPDANLNPNYTSVHDLTNNSYCDIKERNITPELNSSQKSNYLRNVLSFSFKKSSNISIKSITSFIESDNDRVNQIILNNKANIIIRAFRRYYTLKHKLKPNNYLNRSTLSDILITGIIPKSKGVYRGNLSNGLKDGFGITKWNRKEGEKAIFKGIHYRNFANGFGLYTLSLSSYYNNNSFTFSGEFIKDLANGYGIFTSTNRGTYEGEWENDMQNGYGIETWPDGSQYEGQYLKGKKHGIGKYNWGDGSKYIGQWSYNVFQGYGIYTFKDGRVYSGQWENNTMDGYGEMLWKDGKMYIGYSINNKKEGFGLFIWRAKLKAYIGFWENNNQNGLGKYLTEKKVKYGIWSKGTQEKNFANEEEFYDELYRNGMEKYSRYFKYGYKALDMYLQLLKMN